MHCAWQEFVRCCSLHEERAQEELTSVTQSTTTEMARALPGKCKAVTSAGRTQEKDSYVESDYHVFGIGLAGWNARVRRHHWMGGGDFQSRVCIFSGAVSRRLGQ